MLRILRIPSKYFQGKDALLEICQRSENAGNSFLFIASKTAMKLTREKIEKSFEGSDKKVMFELTNGISSMTEIDRIRKIITDNKIDVIAGVGGGSVLDTARAAGKFENIYTIMIPTVAATDAPCTSISMFYSDDGSQVAGYKYFDSNPDMILVDSKIIASAPVRYFVAGMGDALATYFEGRTCYDRQVPTFSQGTISKVGVALTKLCYENLLETGYMAKLAVEKGVVTAAVEDCLESTVFLSAVGGESTGVAAAHGFGNLFANLPDCHDYWHGEKVAVGLIIQLVLENAPNEEIEEVLDFCNSVGLPTALTDIGVKDVEKTAALVAKITSEKGSVKYTKGDTSYDAIYGAIITAQELATSYR